MLSGKKTYLIAAAGDDLGDRRLCAWPARCQRNHPPHHGSRSWSLAPRRHCQERVMESLLGLLFSNASGYAATALAFVVALAVAFFKGRASGKASERAKQDRATFDLIKDHKDATDEVDRLDGSEARDELSRWSKP
jgi:hypothetical protein